MSAPDLDPRPPAPAAPGAGLEHLGVLRFAGPDAVAFLQGQISNDTRPLAAGAAVLGAYSTAQGRVVAILRLLPHSSGVLAILPRELALPTAERLRRFVLRAKVRIEDPAGEVGVLGVDEEALRGAGIEPPAGAAYVESGGLGIARVAPASPRCWLVGSTAALAACPAARSAWAERDWRLADIREGLPQIYAATCESFVAQMLNLDLIGGISFSKGCYTGQEIIARTQHLGRIKRRLHRLRLPAGSWRIGQPLRLADGRSGRLTEVVPIDDGCEALAVLSLEGAADSEAPAGELAAAAELPLPYRLG